VLFHVGLVSKTKRLHFDELGLVSAAIQKQVLRDFSPIWNVDATVDAFASVASVPTDYWIVTIEDFNGTGGFAGIHGVENFQPWARVALNNVWSLTASHEVLEMLADPFRSRLIAGPSIEEPERRVQYLVEICDACQDPGQAYPVNGVMVSDFVTPAYFDPVAATGVRYSFNGTVDGPRQLADGGALVWYDDARAEWRQAILNGAELEFETLRAPMTPKLGTREWVNRAVSQPDWWRRGLPESSPILSRFAKLARGVRRASRARSLALGRRLTEARRAPANRRRRAQKPKEAHGQH
jgi:hypothetical protein